MKSYLTLYISILILSSCSNKSETISDSQNLGEKVNITLFNFQKINKKQSNLDFQNTLKHDLSTKSNLFDYDFFYNGAGVGIVDVNNDGLKDVFFCGNQVDNKLFLNKGNLVFEDISEKANINQHKNWSNGVTFADVNNDGWMDIYVTQGGPYNLEERQNLLYINQKDNTFTEKAVEYGLADTGISTQASFFDFDKDGDLDCIVANENDYYGLDPITFYKILKNKKRLHQSSSHLYKNNNGKFIDITEKSGLLKPTFGLGLCVSDINNDGWLDIYIANDYYVPDALYLNNGNSTFTDQIKKATKQVSFYGMGVDVEDINNDNLNDIFVLDMASADHIRSKTLMASMNVEKHNLLVKKLDLHHQYMFNSLQLNIGNNKFHNVAQVTGLSKTDWSWAGLIFDGNNDENNDIYVTNGYRRYALDNDIRIQISNIKKQYRGKVPLKIKEEIYNQLPSEKLTNLFFSNNGNLNFLNKTSDSGLSEPSFSNGAAYADLDNDGDLDIVVNNIDDDAFLFKNLSTENDAGNYVKIETKGTISEDFAKVTLIYDGKTRTKESKRVRGYLSSVDNTVHFGLGKHKIIDTVRVLWASGNFEEKYNIKANSNLIFNEKDAKNHNKLRQKTNNTLFKKNNTLLNFTHVENEFNDFEKEILLPQKQSTLGPYIVKGDVNNDGKEDVFISGAKNQPAAIYLQKDNFFEKIKNNIFDKDAHYEDMEALFIDIDNDSDLDLYVVSGGNEFLERSESLKDRIYINDGKGNFKNKETNEIKDYTISGKTVSKIDFDNDGDFDIIVGNRIKPQKYPVHEPSIIYENVNGIFKNTTAKIAPTFENFGIINKVITTDFNNDGWQDFIAVGEWTHVGVFLNDKGTFKDISSASKLNTEKGWWNSITETDVNNDGLKDYVIGNMGLNNKLKASKEKPLRIYADDFDENGTHDIVLSYQYDGKYVPLRGKECSTQQMPFISKRIKSYYEFANSSLEDIYGQKLQTSYNREVNEFKSILLLNKGENKFKKIILPAMAQTMPILDGDTFDFNQDGFEDLIVVGNIYNTEVETPRLDNPYGLVLLSNKKDNYTVLPPKNTGLYLNGNAKSVELIHHKKLNKILAIIAVNNGKTELFELNAK
ncbi:Repeat domain-containing protein [Polaribacter sp. Hel1_33_78]|uniref:VCBS repeat-containing protein n=1 Tax=Polaribacter sp. Hel1_33_78 TaxID=1336804 RepID=UPI00087B5B41|nr:VCBS repeat-containing protein [Polaribacter sp. Hel1_33_78]SDU19140.1 Repeat domain-containing protein [Polaribacter sp. Hel1_33_78]